jgi:glutaredoxin
VITLTIYSRPGCHLCEDMKAVIARVVRALPTPAGAADIVNLTEVDVSRDADLEARYGLEIPVLMINGKKAAKYRVDEGALLRMIEAAGSAGGAG